MPRRLVDYPGDRPPPEHLLRGLREIDPVAEMVYIGHGDWLVGRVQPNNERYVLGAYAARLELSHPNPNLEALRDAQLQMQGFAAVATWHFEGEPTSIVVEDFRRRCWIYDRSREAAIREAVRASAGVDAEAQARATANLARAAAPDAWRMSRLKPHSVDMGGLNPLSMN